MVDKKEAIKRSEKVLIVLDSEFEKKFIIYYDDDDVIKKKVAWIRFENGGVTIKAELDGNPFWIPINRVLKIKNFKISEEKIVEGKIIEEKGDNNGI